MSMLKKVVDAIPIVESMKNVVSVSKPTQRNYFCDHLDGKFKQNPSGGRVFTIECVLRGEPGSCYAGDHTVEFRFDKIQENTVGVHFLSAIHHTSVEPETAEVRYLHKPYPTDFVTAATYITSLLNSDWKSEHNDKHIQGIEAYAPHRRHPELFAASWNAEWFSPVFLKAVQQSDFSTLFNEAVPGKVWTFPVLSEKACDLILNEVDGFNSTGLPCTRPNSMNNYGVVLSDIGMGDMVRTLFKNYFHEISSALFPGPGSDCNTNHSFTVRYRTDEDLGLDMHTDDSDVTVNICLGKDFEGAGLHFCGFIDEADHRKSPKQVRHRKGHCLMHRGNLRHGADNITSGERQNLIIWMRNSEYRRSLLHFSPDYVPETTPPDPVCVSFTHDRDYGSFKKFTEKNKNLKGAGWCPPRGYEYPEFKADQVDFR
eukprot:TRINITY_DN16054_c0_g1_i1.p1 TRINITY_DN16054_c0_g1~~TRINITY_DN16054_c0_g1_i1.p1  ORF type:complete len:427 (+),score=47.64 TRINITY_DN16054_c0_g1_i1:383-1663(+)